MFLLGVIYAVHYILHFMTFDISCHLTFYAFLVILIIKVIIVTKVIIQVISTVTCKIRIVYCFLKIVNFPANSWKFHFSQKFIWPRLMSYIFQPWCAQHKKYLSHITLHRGSMKAWIFIIGHFRPLWTRFAIMNRCSSILEMSLNYFGNLNQYWIKKCQFNQ